MDEKKMKEFTVVIPAYNEADKISSTLTQITSFMHSFSASYEVIVVDDGSKDDTAKKVEDYCINNKDVLLIKNSHKGKGVALWTGAMKASGNYVYLCDADLSAPISELKKFSVWIKENGFDIVIATREGTGAVRVNEPLYRHIMGRIFNLLIQLLILPGIKDTQCGFKLFKRDQIRKIFSRLRVYNPLGDVLKDAYLGAYDVEVLGIARKMGLKIKEVPITWKYVHTTRIRPIADSFKMVRDVLKIKFNLVLGKYD